MQYINKHLRSPFSLSKDQEPFVTVYTVMGPASP